MELSSPAFTPEQPIPAKYTGDGEDVSPPLDFGELPEDAASLALIVHDPDAPAGDFVHWTIWNISPATSGLAEGEVPDGAVEGMTGFGKTGWGGPCPPSGSHRYVFELYALASLLTLPEGASREELEAAMAGQILETAELMATYGRS